MTVSVEDEEMEGRRKKEISHGSKRLSRDGGEWVGFMNADLPAAQWSCGAAQLSSDEVIVVVGGWKGRTDLKNVSIGTLLKD